MEVVIPPQFWEDVEQANDRLAGSFILYGDSVVYVERCSTKDKDIVARISLSNGSQKTVSLADPLFHSFHLLPALGYVNVTGAGVPLALHLSRIPERSRTHGLKNGRVLVEELGVMGHKKSTRFDYRVVTGDLGYAYALRKDFPSVSEIIEKLPEGCSAAFSPKYAILLDNFGLMRLFRRGVPIGLIDNGRALLSKQSLCYSEEISEETKELSIEVN